MAEETKAAVAVEKPAEAEKTADGKPEGWDQVELPPPVQKRFNRIYAEMKQSHNDVLALAATNRQLLESVERLSSRQDGKDTDEKADMLKDRKVDAREKGNFAAVAELDDQLAKLRTPAPVQAKAQPAPAKEQRGGITPEQAEVIVEWAQETDEDGNFKRPWAHEGHPKHEQMAEAASMLMGDMKLRARGVAAVLDEIDKKMGMGGRRSVAAVLSGDGGRPAEKTKTLTADEKRVVQLMGITEERYLKSKQYLKTGDRSAQHG